MAENRNCPNCAAPYEVQLNKCPYCGTSYFDLTSIDFEGSKPIYLKIKLPQGTLTQKCIPHCEGIISKSETVYDYDHWGYVMRSYNPGCYLTTDVTFEGIPDNDGNIFNFTIEDQVQRRSKI